MRIEKNIDMKLNSWLRHIIIFLALTLLAGVATYIITPTYFVFILMGVLASYVLIVFEFRYRKKKKEYYNQWKKEGLI